MNNSPTPSGQALDLPVPLHIDRSWLEELSSRLDKGGPWGDWKLAQLAIQGEEARLVTSFDELQCLKHLYGLSPLPHQVDTARRVLFEMSGRAILADEVGLGKTIEAGLILKEYIIRGLVSKVLILVPASLVLQWVRELNSKFGIPAVAQKKSLHLAFRYCRRFDRYGETRPAQGFSAGTGI